MNNELDPNVEAVRAKLKGRAEVGLTKYGVDTTRDDLSDIQWLNHLQEELMDSAVYIERIMGNMPAPDKKPTGGEISYLAKEWLDLNSAGLIDHIVKNLK